MRLKNHTVERIKRKRNDDYTSELLQIERKKLDMLIQKRSAKGEKDTENDEHLLFFKTLLPHVRKISPHQIIPFRTQIQDVVQRFAYPMNYQMLSPSGSTIFSASSASHMAESPSLPFLIMTPHSNLAEMKNFLECASSYNLNEVPFRITKYV